MLASMSNELQRQHDSMDALSILLNLKDLYGEHSRTARYEISKQLFHARMSEGTSVQDHVLMVIDLITRLGQLGFVMDGELNQDLILQSLPESFSRFVLNYHMNKLNVTLSELLNMLKTVESHIKKNKALLLLVDKIHKKKAGKKGSNRRLNPKGGIKKKGKKASGQMTCFHCGKPGHWKRNCKVYLATVKAGASDAPKGMYEIHAVLSLDSSISNSWVLDIACGHHICKSLQGLQNIRVLKEGDFELYGAGGESIQAEAIGNYILKLSSGKILELKDCYYMPKIIRNIVSIPLLLNQGYILNVTSNGCSIYYSNEIIAYGIFNNGLLTLSLNDNAFHIDKKCKRDDVNNILLCHYRLGHISENRISKLHKEKFLEPYDYESLGTCESCLMGKMTKTPFSGNEERTNELLKTST